VDFFLPRPATVKLSKRALPIVPPDVDKLARALLDGLGQGLNGKVGDGVIYGDDSQVVELLARKFYADDRAPGADIRISPL
jgi:Holliday junction resolvase RusA-like endonuclease